YWTKKLSKEGYLADFLPLESIPARRQDLPPAYAISGAMYLIRRSILQAQETLFPQRTLPHVMPAERSLDIDSPWHLQVADLVLKASGR
ncbi:MAG: acylneuraminate cytidylyltransferase family protein, partial [Acidobacteriota bacterium]